MTAIKATQLTSRFPVRKHRRRQPPPVFPVLALRNFAQHCRCLRHPAPGHAAGSRRPAGSRHALGHRRVALLFYEASTRTRTSFELAAKGLGADTASSAPNPPPSKRANRSKTPASRCVPWGPSALFSAIFLRGRPTSWSRSRGCRCSMPAMGCMSIHRRPCLT